MTADNPTYVKPRLLDLFCGAGGAAVGYARAGFEVVGVDIVDQPRYPFEFHQADALEFPLDGFDAVHASPPCQDYSAAKHIHGSSYHPRLIEPVRALLRATRLPYVIENVPGSPLIDPVQLCGLSFGLNVRRHRLFECSFPVVMVPPCSRHDADYSIVFGGSARGRSRRTYLPDGKYRIYRPTLPLERTKRDMGIDWMIRDELCQAIPPAYTEFIGGRLLEEVAASARR